MIEERDELLRWTVDGVQTVVEGVFEHLPAGSRGQPAEHLNHRIHLRVADPEVVLRAGDDALGLG